MDLTVANQSGATRRVAVRSSGSGALLGQTAPILSGDTAMLRLDLPQGAAVVTAGARAIRTAPLVIGPSRASARNDLLLP